MKNMKNLMAAAALLAGLGIASAGLAGTCGSSDKAEKATTHGATFQAASVTTAGGTANSAATADIIDTAVGAGSFKTLATALTAAGLVETLKGSGPFTVFAPTDEAFAKLPKGTLEALLADKAALTKVLTYHVVSGNVLAADVVKLTKATTVQGSTVKIKSNKQGVRVNDANVVKTDVLATNGVIHVIDTVLIPR